MANETHPLPAPENSGISPDQTASGVNSELSPPTPFNIGEEFGTAKKNLPSIKILAVTILAVVIGFFLYALTARSVSNASGAIGEISSVEIPNQNSVMVAVNISITNHGEKPYWIHTIQATLETQAGVFNDQPASAADFDRYFEAFPDLKQHALEPLKAETKILPGGQTSRTILVTFPVLLDAFAARKSLQVTIEPYDQPVPLVLKK
jgi:hypothetical protein